MKRKKLIHPTITHPNLTDNEILVWVSKGCPYTERTKYITVPTILAIMAKYILEKEKDGERKLY